MSANGNPRKLSAGAEQQLNDLGISLPAPTDPFGTYVEAVQTGSLLFLSGMLPTLRRPSDLEPFGVPTRGVTPMREAS